MHKNGANSDESTALHTLCRNGSLEKVKSFVAHMNGRTISDKLSSKKGVFGFTPLHEAVSNGHDDVLEHLLDREIDTPRNQIAPVNCKANSGYTALHLAAGNGHMECVRILVKHNADISILDVYNKTPKETARMNSKIPITFLLHGEEIIKEVRTNGDKLTELLRSGVDKLEPGCLNRALLIATRNDHHRHIAKLILKGASNLEECTAVARDENKPHGRAMLLLINAAQRGNIALVSKLFGENACGLENPQEYKDDNFKCAQEAVKKISTVVPMEIARRNGQAGVREKLLMKTDVDKKKGSVCWQGLQLIQLEVSWLKKIQWVKSLKLATNGFRSLPLEMGTHLKQVVTLDLQRNELEGIPGSILELPCIEELNLSRNKLSRIPNIQQCSARLARLDLSHNQLSSLPESFTMPRLSSLNISHNQFRYVPMCICSNVTLHSLDLSENPDITSLPTELGKLTQLHHLDIDGLRDLTDPPKNMQRNENDVINYLRSKLQGAKEFYRMKLMLIGYENRGKSTLVARLQGRDRRNEVTDGVDISEWSLRTGLGRKAFHFSIWDFGGQEEYYTTHQCFLSKKSLYLLVFNLKHGEEGVKELKPWLNNIALRAPGSRVIIVGTHLDEIEEGERESVDDLLQKAKEVAEGYSKKLAISEILPIGLCNRIENIALLKEVIYQQAAEYKTKNGQPIMGRKIPASYHALDKQLQSVQQEIRQGLRQPVMQEDEFHAMVQEMGLTDLQTLDELKTAVLFLTDVGSILHFDDRGHNLHQLYFLDPRWLCDVMSKVITVKQRNPFIKNGILYYKDIPMLFKDQQFPLEIFEQYLALLDRFEIALPLDNRRVLVPSMLPKETPPHIMEQSDSQGAQHPMYSRFITFKSANTPPGFWSRVLSRIMHFIPQICHSLDKITSKNPAQNSTPNRSLAETVSASSYSVRRLSSSSDSEQEFPPTDSLMITSNEISSQSTRLVTIGLKRFNTKKHQQQAAAVQQTCLPLRFVDLLPNFPNPLQHSPTNTVQQSPTNVKLEYWRTGLYYSDSTLTFSIQSLQSHKSECREGVTIRASRSDEGREIVSQLVDLVTSLISDWYSGLKDDYVQESPCYKCLCEGHEKPFLFSNKKCLLKLMEGKSTIKCEYSVTENHEVAVVDVFPDLLINRKFLLSQNEIICTSKLGSGGYGEVFKGKYRGRSVAIKKYNFSEGRTPTLTEQFKELRIEAKMLQKLHHPCLVCMIGICIHPEVMALVLEIAPRRCLDSAVIDKEEASIHRVTTYRIAAQVAAGLRFLHGQGIIFRDLKAANVLLWTLDPNSLCHCKLTDFGIAIRCSPIGAKGVHGTKGFTAPEMIHLSKNPGEHSLYTHKADIFSFGMFLYQMITRRNPYHDVPPLRINPMISSGERPTLEGVELAHTGYYYLTQLMKSCWQDDPKLRPTTEEIIQKTCLAAMQSVMCVQPISGKYSLRRSAVVTAPLFATNKDRHSQLWVCSASTEGTQVSVYNTHTMVKVNQNFISDNQVQCIALCRDHIWVSSRTGIGHATLDIYSVETHEHVHNIATKDNSVFCITSNATTVYLGTVEGYCFCFPNDIETVRNTGRPKFRYISEHAIDGIACTDQCVWLSSTKTIHFLNPENLSTLGSIKRVVNIENFVGQLSLSPEKNIIWSAHLGGSLLTAWNAKQRVHMYDVNTALYLRKIADIRCDNDAIITAMTPALDTVWVGMTSGHILVFNQDELLIWYHPYAEYVRFLTCIPGRGPCGAEECIVASGGKNLQPVVDGLEENTEESKTNEEANDNVIILWETYKSRMMMQMKIVEVNSHQLFDNHASLCKTIKDGEFKDGTEIVSQLREKEDQATCASPGIAQDTHYKPRYIDSYRNGFGYEEEEEQRATASYFDRDGRKQEYELKEFHSLEPAGIPLTSVDQTHGNRVHVAHLENGTEPLPKPPHIVTRQTSYSSGRCVLQAFDIQQPNSFHKYRITCQKPAKLEILLNKLQMDATLSQEECQIEYHTESNERMKIETQEQFDAYLALPKRPQIWLSQITTDTH